VQCAHVLAKTEVHHKPNRREHHQAVEGQVELLARVRWRSPAAPPNPICL
jgi:hypothetical protein